MSVEQRDNYVQAVTRRIDQECPNLDPALRRLYALLVLVRGDETTLEDVHDAWAVWRDATVPDHRSLVPFDRLTPKVQELDRPYRDAIGRVAKFAREGHAPVSDPKIRIVSDGVTEHTQVTVDGEPLAGVTKVSWSAVAGEEYCTAEITVAGVEVDVVGTKMRAAP